MICKYCDLDFHTMCEDECSCEHQFSWDYSEPLVEIVEDSPETEDGPRNVNPSRVNKKRDAALVDQQSTGRKRAAKLYPLFPENPCEWQGKANVGGGKHPIYGCSQGQQQARHHGPDKSTSNNEQGNVHRICHGCHNRWHTANDFDYDWNSPQVNPHSPRELEEGEESKLAPPSEGGMVLVD